MINNVIAVEFMRDTASSSHISLSLYLYLSFFLLSFILVFTSMCCFHVLACVSICLTHRNIYDALRTIIEVIDVNCLQLSKGNLRMGLWLWLRYAINRRLRRFSPNFRYWIKCFVCLCLCLCLCVCDVRRRRLLMCPHHKNHYVWPRFISKRLVWDLAQISELIRKHTVDLKQPLVIWTRCQTQLIDYSIFRFSVMVFHVLLCLYRELKAYLSHMYQYW